MVSLLLKLILFILVIIFFLKTISLGSKRRKQKKARRNLFKQQGISKLQLKKQKRYIAQEETALNVAIDFGIAVVFLVSFVIVIWEVLKWQLVYVLFTFSFLYALTIVKFVRNVSQLRDIEQLKRNYLKQHEKNELGIVLYSDEMMAESYKLEKDSVKVSFVLTLCLFLLGVLFIM